MNAQETFLHDVAQEHQGKRVDFWDSDQRLHSAHFVRINLTGEWIVRDLAGNEFAVDLFRIRNLSDFS